MMESQGRFIGPRTMAGNPPVRRVCPRPPRSFLYKACPFQEQGASVPKKMFTCGKRHLPLSDKHRDTLFFEIASIEVLTYLHT